MKKYKIAITDDHLLFAEGISKLIANKPDMELAFIASSATEMFFLLQQHAVDFLILDINLPPYNGLALIDQLKEEYKQLKIMILSMYQPTDIGLELSGFKGDAYVLKISGKHILEAAIESLKKSKLYFDPNIEMIKPVKDSFTAQLKLTKREKEIISLIALGKSTKEIANQLFISELTVKTHRKNISEKLGSKGVADFISKTSSLGKDKY